MNENARPRKPLVLAEGEVYCRRLKRPLPLAEHELEFLERLNGAGDIVPEVLTDVPATQAVLRDHPGLTWKALHVKKRRGGVADDQEPPA